jgi:hypothetical protein
MTDETQLTEVKPLSGIVQPDAAPWYELAVVQRLVLGITLHLIGASPLAKYLAGADLAPYVDQGLELLGMAIDSWALHARITKPCPPAAISRASADKINAAAAPTTV